MFSQSQIRKLHIDFMKEHPEATEEELNQYFENFFLPGQRDQAYIIWNNMFLDGSLDNPHESKETGAGTKWVPDEATAARFLAKGGSHKLTNVLILDGYKEWVKERREGPSLSVEPYRFPGGGNTIASYFRNLGYERQNATNYFWEKGKPHNRRITWDPDLGLLIFEKLKGTADEALEGVNNNMDKEEKGKTQVEGAATEAEEEMYGFEAMDRTELDKLQASLATKLESEGAVSVLNAIQESGDYGTYFSDQINYIKNTIDLSNTQEVLNAVMDAAETLLDDMQVETIAETLSDDMTDFDSGEDIPEGEYQEPEDWSAVDEDMPTKEDEGSGELNEGEPVDENGEGTIEEGPAPEEGSADEPNPEDLPAEGEGEEAHESIDGEGDEVPATESLEDSDRAKQLWEQLDTDDLGQFNFEYCSDNDSGLTISDIPREQYDPLFSALTNKFGTDRVTEGSSLDQIIIKYDSSKPVTGITGDAFEAVEVDSILPEGCSVYVNDDGEEAPYLVGSMDEPSIEVMDRDDLTEEELWATGWTGILQNGEKGPFNSFEEMDIIAVDDEKEGEYTLPELPEEVKAEFLQAVNNYINGTSEEEEDNSWRAYPYDPTKNED